MVNYFPVYSFMRNLTSLLMPFWLVFLTEQKVLYCYAMNMVYRYQLYPSCGFSSTDLMLSSFQPLSANLLNALCAPYSFDR